MVWSAGSLLVSRRHRISARAWAALATTAVAGALVLAFAGTLLVVSVPLAHPDAIVSLASHEWERLPLTTNLALQNPGAIVLLTQPQQPSLRNCYECGARVARLTAAGIGADRIRVLPLTAPGTYGEAVACRDFLTGSTVRHLLVVTSPYHTRRALAVFRSVLSERDVEVGVAPASPYSPARPPRWWLSLYDVWYVTYEWAATAYYLGKYGVPLTAT